MSDADPGLHRVVAGLLVRGNRILLAHRSPGRRWYPDVWDFPGGHVEPGEDEATALARELVEELGVTPTQVDEAPVARVVRADLRLSLWVVRSWQGEPTNLRPDEHDDVRWIGAEEIAGLRLAHPSYGELIGRVLAG